MCTDELWQKEKKFFYMTYHTTIFLDYYLSNPVKTFAPALPYTLVDESQMPAEAVDDVIPDRLYSKEEVLSYLASIRKKCKDLILNSSSDKLLERWIDNSETDLHGLCPSIVKNYTLLEIILYNLRHVQHHGAQLNLILKEKIGIAPGWVSHAD
ncbi:hypothetical protein C900_02693 [Fulvivirga imtechensis AK7]|uniref:DinB-like domain-containing protein n=2 Tax=Fulvivirga TaxID=396811 RepID=L8JZM6_9BACT|nr:hypothetical protein C900_02693 [Fulvivirga imtechensis AK7]